MKKLVLAGVVCLFSLSSTASAQFREVTDRCFPHGGQGNTIVDMDGTRLGPIVQGQQTAFALHGNDHGHIHNNSDGVVQCTARDVRSSPPSDFWFFTLGPYGNMPIDTARGGQELYFVCKSTEAETADIAWQWKEECAESLPQR